MKKSESAVLRSEASNTFEAMPHASGAARSRIRLPKRKRIHLAVHRHDNMLYYKRLDPEAFVILAGVARGRERRGSLFARPLFHEAHRRGLDRGNQGLLQQLGVARLVLPVLEKMKKFQNHRQSISRWFVPSTSFLQSLLLLVIRLYWGWAFFLTGKGKLMDLDKPTEFFQSLGIPLPHAQAMLAGATECFGGLLLLAGSLRRG